MDNFIVSARKYRPATFRSVVGQDHITSTLKNAIARSQLAHAYLFCGPRGVGKTTCARIFAKAINCQNPVDNEACGHCESCRSFDEGRSFNIHELDAASNNSVDYIRELIDQVRVPPQTGKYSVYIIDEVHMLSASAFNAFLKTLEEPPQHAIFILATTEKHKVLPTILSRCQIYDFNRIRVEESVAYLKYIAKNEGIDYDEESLNLISQKADGGMRDALSMFDKAVSFCGNRLTIAEVAKTLNILDYDTYFNMVDLFRGGDYRSALVLYDQILSRGFSGQTFIAGLSSHLRDLLMSKEEQTAPLLEVSGELLNRYKRQGERCDVPFLFGAIALLSTVDSGFRTATNQRLHVELALMKLCGLGRQSAVFEPVAPILPRIAENPTATPNPQPTAQPQPVARQPQAAPEQRAAAPQPAPQPVATKATDAEQPTNTSENSGQSATTPQFEVRNIERTERAETKIETHATPDAQSEQATVNLSGFSLRSILSNPATTAEPTEQKVEEKIDPQTEQKIEGCRDEFVTALRKVHPRLANVMETMKVSGNRVTATAQTKILYEEMMRNLPETNQLLKQIGRVEGRIDYSIELNEQQGTVRPTKVEDKYNFLVEQNRYVVDLRKELDLETE